MDESANEAYLIKASKRWMNGGFDYNYKAIEPSKTQITGLAKEVTDYQTSSELSDRLSQLEGVNFPLGTLNCLSINYKRIAILKLIDVVMFIFVVISGVYIFNNKDNIRPLYLKIWILGMMAPLVILIGIIR